MSAVVKCVGTPVLTSGTMRARTLESVTIHRCGHEMVRASFVVVGGRVIGSPILQVAEGEILGRFSDRSPPKTLFRARVRDRPTLSILTFPSCPKQSRWSTAPSKTTLPINPDLSVGLGTILRTGAKVQVPVLDSAATVGFVPGHINSHHLLILVHYLSRVKTRTNSSTKPSIPPTVCE